MPIIKCAYCGTPKNVRQADLNRGWGKYCSKSCKAKAQEKRTGQFRDLCERSVQRDSQRRESGSNHLGPLLAQRNWIIDRNHIQIDEDSRYSSHSQDDI